MSAQETTPCSGDAAPAGSALERIRSRGRVRAVALMFGPAFVAAVAYVDPGNFATNFAGGARYGYRLMWVVLLANLMAMPIQYLSAKLGIVTGMSLPRACRERFGRTAARGLWAQAELIAMATDLAEFVGAAVGLNLLFGVPPTVAAAITAVIAFVVLGLQSRGVRRFEVAVVALLAVILAGFLYETLRIGPDARGAVAGLIPTFDGAGSVLLAVGIVGATAMPHVIYLHSALTTERVPWTTGEERRSVLRFERYDVVIALGIAGLINMAMLAVAAKLFHGPAAARAGDVTTLEGAHAGLGTLIGGGAALAFAVALLASGISSSSVGTFAGQVIMDGFIRRRIPLVARRAITMAPAIALLAAGIDPTAALVLSQVLLSFGIPFALIPLVLLTSSRKVMGAQASGRAMTALMIAITATIVALNLYLLYRQFLA
ncbi:MAG TPA: Nramp family divalent metal transporter [Streptosporangiaceae bacterium]|jgi:manganese transport protein